MRFLIYTIIIVAPLFFGSVPAPWQWFWVLWSGVIALTLLITSLRGNSVSLSGPVAFPAALALVFVGWGFVQALAPVGNVVYYGISSVDTILTKSEVLSVIPEATINNSFFFLGHVLVFTGTYLYCKRRERVVRLIRFCSIVGGLYAMYGFAIFVSGNEYVLWQEKMTNFNSLSSSFINRNNYAAYAGLGLQCLIAFSYFWAQSEIAEGRVGKERARQILEVLLTKAWWLPLAIFLVGTSLLLTNSRAGFAASAAAVFLLFLLSPNNFGSGKNLVMRRSIFAIVLIAVSGILFTISGEVLEARLENSSLDALRTMAYDTIPAIIAEYPLTGTGLGTFEDVFLFYQPKDFHSFFDRAHSDHLEIIVTAGIPASIILYLAFIYIAFKLASALKFGLQYRSFIALGITAMVQIGLHAIVDFPLQIPAISYLWVIIIAASLAVSERCRQSYKPPTR